MNASTRTQGEGKQPAPENAQREPPPSAWEWLVAGVGLLLLLASIGYLLHDAFTGEDGPPVPVVRLVDMRPQEGRYLVQVKVVNQGRATAAALRVEGELRRGAEVVERSEIEFEHVPGRSSREGGLFFLQDPRALQLVLTARSYRKP